MTIELDTSDQGTQLAKSIAALVQGGNIVLFAGAGCSAEANIPVWKDYLELLAGKAEQYESETASLMRRRISTGDYLQAATLFRRILNAPPGDKLNAICKPFRPGSYSHATLLPLASLPFCAMITTNYDSSLFEAWTKITNQQSSPHPQLLTTKHTKGAAYISDPFFLFLHGQASVLIQAEDIVFDEEDYKRCYNDPSFTDGLLQLLSTHTCLFLGFSFRDPGIDAVLRMWTHLRGPAFPRKHFAVLPQSESRLARDLTSMNVQVLCYDDALSGHTSLWNAVREAAGLVSSAGSAPAAIPDVSQEGHKLFGAARDVLAMCYARASLGTGIQPLRNLVLDGVTLAVIAEDRSNGIAVRDLVSAIAQKLGMPVDEIGPQVQLAIQRLLNVTACRSEEDRIVSTGGVPDTLSDRTKSLAEHVLRRIELREGVRLPAPVLTPLAQAFEDLLMARAWDLAAHFVQPRSGALHGINDAVSQVLLSTKFPEGTNVALVERGLIELLVRPNNKEAELLADLGRVAFAVQLALGNARSAFAYTLALPQRVYLDASVLMPAIVDGHPLTAVYWPVLERLRNQAAQAGGQLAIVAPFEFLNEVITHRQNAIREVTNRHFEDPQELEREVLLYSAENLNVFVGAYATHVGRAKRKISFQEFLKQHAPYGTEDTLRQYLEQKGLRVEQLASGPASFKPLELWNWFNPLLSAYEEEEQFGGRQKPSILVEHEAWQLFRLETDHQNGIRSVFVTADGRLRRSVASIRDGKLADALLSGVTMVKLVDLLLGVHVDHRGLARLLWGVHAVDPSGAVRQYFTDLGLKRQGDIETLALPKVVDQIMTEVEVDSAFPDLPIISSDIMGRARVADFLDRFEDRFYELLDAAVKARLAKEEDRQPPPAIRKATRSGWQRSKKKR